MKQKGKEAKKYIQANQAGGGTLYQKKQKRKANKQKEKEKKTKSKSEDFLNKRYI